MFSDELKQGLIQLIKKHKQEILAAGYRGQDKGMTVALSVEFETDKALDIVFSFVGQKWPAKGKGKKSKVKI